MNIKSFFCILGSSLAFAGSSSAVAYISSTFDSAGTASGNTADYTFIGGNWLTTVNGTTDPTPAPDKNLQFQNSGDGFDVTWTINPGVTVSGGRFFVGNATDPDVTDSHFTVAGGGTLNITRNNTFNLRLGQNNASEIGILSIIGGSKVIISGSTLGEFEEQSGSYLELDGIGSSFSFREITDRSYAATDSVSGFYTSQTGDAGKIPFQLGTASSSAGHTLQSSSSGGFTTITVVPEPSSALLIGSAGLLLLFRRRN